MKLAELQQVFSQHLLYQAKNTDNLALDSLKISGPFVPEQLMSLYRNNFYISLTEYLLNCFPTVESLVGEEFFAQLAKAFIIESPLESANIEAYGASFLGFIRHCEQAKPVPYLADIAQLDWSFDKAKTECLQAEFPFALLQKISSEDQLKITFKLQLNTILVKSNYPVLSIWQGIKNGSLENIDMQVQECVIVTADKLAGARIELLSALEYEFLSAVNKQENLKGLSSLDNFQQLLNQFITSGVINNFILEGEV